MSEVYLDGARVEFEDTGAGATVGELVDALAGELEKLGRVVAGVEVDGRAVVSLSGGGELDSGLGTCAEVKVFSAPVEAVAMAGVDVVRGYAEFIGEAISGCVNGIRLGTDMAEKTLSAVIEGVGEMTRTLDALSGNPAVKDIGFFKDSRLECYKGLLSCLEAVDAARRSGDAITIADVLEYELAPLVMEIKEGLGPVEPAELS